MQQEHGAAVRFALRGNIHICHAQGLAGMCDRQHMDRVGIGEAFEGDAVRLLGARGLRRRIFGMRDIRREKHHCDRSQTGAAYELSQIALP